MTDWPEPVERVNAYLRAAGVEARVEEFPAGTPTAGDAAHAIGCRRAQIVKSIVFDCDRRWVLVLVPGDRRVDGTKVAAAAGCTRAYPAGAEAVVAATGFEPGAVAPFPQREIWRTFADPALLGHRTVWIGAGSARHMAALGPRDLVRLARAQVVEIAEE